MKKLVLLLFSFSPLAVAQSMPTAALSCNLLDAGGYSSTPSYRQCQVVTEGGISYKSLVNGNHGNDPATDGGTHWVPLYTLNSVTLAAAIGGAPVVTPPAPSDIIGDFFFNSTTGLGVNDSSGNGNNATITTSTGLVRDGLGFTFGATSEVDYTGGLNGAKTIYILANFPPGVVGVINNLTAAVLSSSNATGGSLEILGYQSTLSNSGGIYGVWVRGNGSPLMIVSDVYAGVHLITVSCTSSSTSAIYLDTVPLPLTSYQAGPAACASLQSSGHFLIGPSASNPSLTPAGITVYRETFASGSHTAAQVSTFGRAILNQARIAGVPIDPIIYRGTKRNWVFAGDSQTCGTGLTSTPACNVGTYSPLAHPTIAVANTTVNSYNVQNFGIPGEYIQGQLAALPSVYCPFANTIDGVSNASIQEGTNNFLTSGVTAAQVWAFMAAWGHNAAACGFRPIVNTMSSRGGNDANGTSYDTDMVTLNGLIRANWKSAGFAAVWDGGTWPAYGAVGAAGNATNFPDTIHYSAAIQSTQGISEACLADHLDGSSPGNMNPIAVTSSRTLTCADGGLNVNAVGGNVNLTFLTAQFLTDLPIRICNITPSGSNTVTATAPSDFTFNNVSGATTKTVSAGTCVNFVSTWNGLTTSSTGGFWKTM
jgi:hypothetical protein